MPSENDTSTTAVEDTSAPEPVSQATPSAAAPETGDPATPNGQSETATVAGAGQHPLKSSQTQEVTAPNQPGNVPRGTEQSSVNWEERYKQLQSYADRKTADATARAQKYEQELKVHQAKLAEIEKAKVARPWEPAHPEHKKFGGLLERARAINRQIQATAKLPQEQQQMAQQAIMAAVTPEEQQTLEQYRENLQEQQQRFFEDPKAFIHDAARDIVRNEIQSVQAEYAGKAQVETDWEQPHIKALIDNPQYSGYLKQQLDSGIPYEAAMDMMKMRAVVDLQQAKIQELSRTEVHAQEQTRLVKGKAARGAVADPATSSMDPYKLAMKEAQKQGITPGSAAFNRLLNQYTNNMKG